VDRTSKSRNRLGFKFDKTAWARSDSKMFLEAVFGLTFEYAAVWWLMLEDRTGCLLRTHSSEAVALGSGLLSLLRLAGHGARMHVSLQHSTSVLLRVSSLRPTVVRSLLFVCAMFCSASVRRSVHVTSTEDSGFHAG
jgi:hypothetical protein